MVLVVQDALAPSLWARFYEIESNKPIFADRDGVPKSALADTGYERRNGYAWYGRWPQNLLEIEYPEWKRAISAVTVVEQVAVLPDDTALLQNYPNPFNSDTVIRFALATRSDITLSLCCSINNAAPYICSPSVC
jgi:hypothetical protein